MGHPAPDIIRAYLKVEQRSRETQRAIRNWRRHWFARRNEKATLFAAGYLVGSGSAVPVLPPTSEERQPQSYRV